MFVGAEYLQIITDKELTDFQVRLFFYLAVRAGKAGKCYPKQETIAEELGGSRKAVSAAIAALREKGYITEAKRGRLREYGITLKRVTVGLQIDPMCNRRVTVICNRRVTLEKNKKRINKNGMVRGSSRRKTSQRSSFRFNFDFDPDPDNNRSALSQLKAEIDRYNREERPNDDQYILTVQSMADFLEILKTGRLKNGNPVTDPGKLLLARLKQNYDPGDRGNVWAYERALEDWDRIENGQAVNFTFMEKSYTLGGN